MGDVDGVASMCGGTEEVAEDSGGEVDEEDATAADDTAAAPPVEDEWMEGRDEDDEDGAGVVADRSRLTRANPSVIVSMPAPSSFFTFLSALNWCSGSWVSSASQ